MPHRPRSLLAVIGLLATAVTAAPPTDAPPNRPGGIGGFGIQPPSPTPSDGAKLARMDLLIGHRSLNPGGEGLLGVRWRIAPKWHLYWRNPGDSGTAPQITVTGPDGLKVGEIRWPRPIVFTDAWGDITYGYEKEVVLLVPFTVPATTPPGEISLGVRAEWLVCKQACLLGEGRGVVPLDIRKGVASPKDPDPTIERALALVPKSLKSLRGAVARLEPAGNPERLVIEGPAGTAESVEFVPDLTPGVVAGSGHPVKGSISEEKFRIEVPLEIEPGNAVDGPLVAAGLVTFGPRPSDPAFRVELPFSP